MWRAYDTVSSVCGSADGKSWCGTRTIDVYDQATNDLLSPSFITYSETTDELTVYITDMADCKPWTLLLRANLPSQSLSNSDTLLESNFNVECESLF